MALHSALLAPTEPALVTALRAGTPLADERLEALRLFARAITQTRARPDADAWRAFEAAGYTEANALDVVLGVGVYVLSTYLNLLTESELDAPFQPFAWQKPPAA